ncbi:XrtA/PEP-CTERM system TPR-repeat protein PrsT [Thiobacter aerophilum]|uniref:XrtA/PEP-CTERM system TPR-repeat protein PrsT n=1 Tax=Thiobacter aerophilum TaxID=3121275 RepID=A0ABV0EEN0_9BURK
MRTLPFCCAAVLALGLTLSGCDRLLSYTDQEHVQRAKDFQAKGDLRAAEIELKNAVAKNPKNPEARLELGKLYLTLRQGMAAQKELAQAINLGAQTDGVKLSLGQALLLANQPEQALAWLKPGPQTTDRMAAKMLATQGDAHLALRKPREACDLYQRAADRDPQGATEAYWGLAVCQALRRDLAGAQAILEKARDLDPNNDGTWARLGEVLQTRGDTAGAEKAYVEALRLNPGNLEALIGHGVLAVNRGRLRDAERDLKNLTATGIETPGRLYLAALVAAAKKNGARALEILGTLAKAYPDYFPAWLLAARVHYAQKHLASAEQYVDRYLAVQPGDLAAVGLKATLLLDSGRAAEVPDLLAPYLARYPDDVHLLYLAGRAYLETGDAARARASLEKAVALKPEITGLKTPLAAALLAQGERLQAVNLLAAASAADASHIDADLLLVAAHLQAERYGEALAAVAAIEKKRPRDSLADRLRAGIHLRQGDRAAARHDLERALAKAPTDFAATAALAELDLGDGHPEAARQRFLTLLGRDRGSVPAMLALARLAASGEREKEFLEWTEQASRAAPQALAPQALLAEYYLSKGKREQALRVANAVQSAHPDDPLALDLLARTQLAAGDLRNALASYGKLAEARPNDVGPRVGLVRAHMMLKQYPEARSTLEAALKRWPGMPALLEAAAQLEILAGRPEVALTHARALAGSDQAGVAGLLLEGDALVLMKKPAEATRVFESALARAPQGETMARLARALWLAGRGEEADRRLDGWLAEHPRDAAARRARVDIALARGQTALAVRELEALLAQRPQDATALNDLAVLYHEQGDARALEVAERAYRLAPDAPMVQDTLGWILIERKALERGRELIEQAYAGLPHHPVVRYHRAVALAQSGERAQARRELEALLKGGENFPEKAQARALLASLRGE